MESATTARTLGV